MEKSEYTTFICKKCKKQEQISIDIVRYMDKSDKGNLKFPPAMACKYCNGIMTPEYFIGHTGIIYKK